MASLNHLSDDELRKKLKEYGITSPVTSSTRSILLKKLNHAISDRRSSSKFQLDGNTKPVRVSPRTRNSSYAASYNVSKKKSNLNAYSSDEEDNEENNESNSESETQPSRRTGNESPISNFVKSTSNKRKTPILRKRTGYSPLNSYSEKSNNYQYDTGSESDLGDEVDSSSRRNVIDLDEIENSNHLRKGSLLSQNSYSYKNQRLKAIANHLLPTKPSGNKYETQKDEISSRDSFITQEYEKTHNQRNGHSPLYQMTKITSDGTTDKEFCWSSVPILLVSLLTLFFCVLGLCYVSIHYPFSPSALLSYINVFKFAPKYIEYRSDSYSKVNDKEVLSSYQAEDSNKFPFCVEEKDDSNCLTSDELENVSKILGLLEIVILPALSRQAGQYQCGEVAHHHLTVEDVSDLILEELPEKSSVDMSLGLRDLEKLSELNPHWGIKPFYNSENLDSSQLDLIGFGTTAYPREFICHITSALFTLLYVISLVLVVISAFWIGIQGLKHYKKRTEEADQQSFELVEQILEVLEKSCGTGGKEYIAVNHVRDCLIPPRERMAKSAIWNKAVKFIDEHDSRVYREIRSVGGDDREVWRWVSGAPRSPISCTTSALQDNNQPQEKVWQGQAFESLESTQNLPQISPTSCLKVRHMFDSEIEYGENWPRRIQDSLLEKCENVSILHVAVDRVSKEGCVYVKCASAAEAGKAYRALHGWWFDGNLVTVKYLRDERYHERFPTARIATTPLNPSNNKRLSLQTNSFTDAPPSNEPEKKRYSRRVSRRS